MKRIKCAPGRTCEQEARRRGLSPVGRRSGRPWDVVLVDNKGREALARNEDAGEESPLAREARLAAESGLEW